MLPTFGAPSCKVDTKLKQGWQLTATYEVPSCIKGISLDLRLLSPRAERGFQQRFIKDDLHGSLIPPLKLELYLAPHR